MFFFFFFFVFFSFLLYHILLVVVYHFLRFVVVIIIIIIVTIAHHMPMEMRINFRFFSPQFLLLCSCHAVRFLFKFLFEIFMELELAGNHFFIAIEICFYWRFFFLFLHVENYSQNVQNVVNFMTFEEQTQKKSLIN